MNDENLPKITLTPELVAQLLSKTKPFSDLEPALPKKKYFHCEYCRDTHVIEVYGGPNTPCSYCGPKN